MNIAEKIYSTSVELLITHWKETEKELRKVDVQMENMNELIELNTITNMLHSSPYTNLFNVTDEPMLVKKNGYFVKLDLGNRFAGGKLAFTYNLGDQPETLRTITPLFDDTHLNFFLDNMFNYYNSEQFNYIVDNLGYESQLLVGNVTHFTIYTIIAKTLGLDVKNLVITAKSLDDLVHISILGFKPVYLNVVVLENGKVEASGLKLDLNFKSGFKVTKLK